MSKFNQGDAVIATLPVVGFYSSVTLFIVTQTDGLVTCLYFDGQKPVSVVIPAIWLQLKEEPKDELMPHMRITNY